MGPTTIMKAILLADSIMTANYYLKWNDWWYLGSNVVEMKAGSLLNGATFDG